MKKQFITFASFIALVIAVLPGIAVAGDVNTTNSLIGAQGYDLVSYHKDGPKKGNGNHVAEYKGVSYVFASEDNKKAFEANPAKYVPAYGGYCAYGVSVGKKFVGDPEVWKIVDGRLFLNLDKKVQGIWEEDISGNIANADAQWDEIKHKAAADL